MGAGLWPAFEPALERVTPHCDGKLVLRACEALDALSQQSGVPRFTSFADSRPVPDGFEGDPDDLADLLGPWSAWFQVEDGIACFVTLADTIRAGELSHDIDDAEGVADELRDLVRCLSEAKAAGRTRFRLELVV